MNAKRRIAVNTRLLLKDKMEGIGYFTYETIGRIVRAHPDIEFHLLFDRPYDSSFIFADNVRPVVLLPQARHPFLWYWWFECSVAGYLRKNKFDLFLSPEGYGCLRTDTPTVAVMHDIAFEHYPDMVPALHSLYYRYYTPRYINHSARIATVSEFSKADIVHQYGTDPDKIDVVYSAAKEIFKPISPADQSKTREQFTDGHPYLIYVGSIHPRKNLKNMLLGFQRFKKNNPTSDLKFLVVGAFGWQNSELKTVMSDMECRDEVIFLGRQPVDLLSQLIAGAYALMYVSCFEGFGVPPLEAMQSAVPAISATVSSMPEICGDAALLADPADPDSIAAQIDRLWAEPDLRIALIDKGLSHCRQYTWVRTAQLLWDSCNKVLAR